MMPRSLFLPVLLGVVLVSVAVTAEKSSVADIRVVRVERASIDAFKDRPLTCVVVEIGSERGDSNFVLGNKNVLGKTPDGAAVPVLVIFVAEGSREVFRDTVATGPISLVGWQIGVGDQTFKTFGEGSRPAAVFDAGADGSIKYTFTKPAKVQMGLVFPKEPNELIEVQILGKALKLAVPPARRPAPEK